MSHILFSFSAYTLYYTVIMCVYMLDVSSRDRHVEKR